MVEVTLLLIIVFTISWLIDVKLGTPGMLLGYCVCLALLSIIRISTSSPTLPPLQLPSTNFTLDVPGDRDRNIQCDEGFGTGLSLTDCDVAIAALPHDQPNDVTYDPQDHKWNYPEFTRVNPEDRHRLPISASFGGCVVSVGLEANRDEERSSWRIIKLRAGNVVSKCVSPLTGQRGIGGAVTTGENLGMVINVYEDRL